MNKNILLIDGSSFVFRAFYALPELSSPDGFPTGVLYGVTNMLRQMLNKYQGKYPYWVCVFDTKGKTFRDDIYPEYKANRRETPKDLIQQLPELYKIIENLGMKVVMQEGFEADDIIGSIATQYQKLGYDTLIATGDKDFAQLVNSNITLINTMTNEALDRDGVITKFGVKPEQIIDYLSLVGDTVDNVKGIEKCGPKTAVKWLTQYNNIDTLIKHADDITGVIGGNLRDGIHRLDMVRFLITIKQDMDLSTLGISTIQDMELLPQNNIQLAQIYKTYNFKTWFRQTQEVVPQIATTEDDLFSTPQPEVITSKSEGKLILNNRELLVLLDLLEKDTNYSAFLILEEKHGINLEPHAITFYHNNICYVYKINITQDLISQPNQDEFNDEIRVKLQQYLSTNLIVSYNIKKQLYLLKKLDIELKTNKLEDIQLLSYVQNSQEDHTLSQVINRFNNTNITKEDEFYGKASKTLSTSAINNSDLLGYIDSCISNFSNTMTNIKASMQADEIHLYQNIELPVAFILFNIENNGIKIDKHIFAKLSQQIKSQITEIETRIHRQTNTSINLNSTKQLQDLLFNQLALPTAGIRKNTNGYSTDENTLNILSGLGIEIASLLLEYRNLSKLFNTYVDKLPNLVDSQDRLHTRFEQTLVTSGRLSSKEPNLQNIPVKNMLGKEIRSGFIAADGCQLICADYSQIELRILAHITHEENLIQAFTNKQDVHAITASDIFGITVEAISPEQRRFAKTINFGLIYGQGAYALAKQLEIDIKTAKEYINKYFSRYSKVKYFMDNIKNKTMLDGYVSTIMGRRVYIPSINSSNAMVQNAAARLALNSPMQGSSADIIKIAMINIDEFIQSNNLSAKIVLQVHDELIIETPTNEIDIIKSNLPRLMSDGINISVPLLVDIKSANNWNEAH